MRLAYALLAGALIAIPLAHAQADNATSDPTVNQSDFDTSTPPADDSYLNDTSSTSSSADNGTAGDPTLNDSDLDTSVPTDDTSWLNDDVSSADATPADASPSGHAATPGFGVALVVGALAVGAFVASRRR